MSFSFDEYISEEEKSPIEPASSPNVPKEQKFSFDEFIDTTEEEPSILSEAGRHVARTGSRIAETIGGFLGDINQFAQYGGEKVGQYLGQKSRKLLGKEELTEEQLKGVSEEVEKRKTYPQKALDLLPTSSELQEITSSLTSGFTDPQSAQEKFGDDVISLGTALYMGRNDPSKFKSLVKSMGLASGAKLAGEGAELLGAGGKEKAAVEVGSLLLTSLLSKNYMNAVIGDKYKQARSLIPNNTMVSSGDISSGLSRLKTQMNKGLPKASITKRETINLIEELEKKVAGGAVPIEDMVEAYHDVNELKRSKKLFGDLSKPEKKLMRHRIDQVQDEIRKPIKEYGNNNPKFYKTWSEANQAKAVLSQAETAKDFIISNMKSLPGHILTGAAIKAMLGIPAISAAGAGIAAFQLGKVLNRMAQNPTLRKYYIDVINSSIKENLPATLKSLDKLDKEIKKDEKSNTNQSPSRPQNK